MPGNTDFRAFVGIQTTGTAEVDKISTSFDRLSQSIDKAGEASKKASSGGGGFGDVGSRIQQGLTDPFGAASSAAETLFGSLGKVGTVAAGAVGIFTAASVAGFGFARSLGDLADSIGDTSVRLGLSAKETSEFSLAMKLAGGSIEGLEGIMRKLSQGLADNGDAGKKSREGLRDLGIVSRDIHGQLVPTSSVLVQLSERLSAIKNPAEQGVAAIKILGKGALEVLPDLLELSERLKRAKELNLAPSEAELARWNKYHDDLVEVDAAWDKLVRKFKEPLAATILFLFKTDDGKILTPGTATDFISGVAQMALGGGGAKGQDGVTTGQSFSRSAHRAEFEAANAGLLASGAGSLGSFLGSGLEGARAKLSELRSKYDEARTAAQVLADTGKLLPEVAAKHRIEVEGALGAYKRQEDLVKSLEKADSRRLAVLGRMAELTRQGIGFYQLGTGGDSTILPIDKINEANQRPRGIPSLFGRGQVSPFAVAGAINAQEGADLGQGLQVINGQVTFVSPSSSRTTQIGGESVEQLNARSQGSTDQRLSKEQATLAIFIAEKDNAARIVELRAGPGGEADTALAVARLRKQALLEELSVTGDIARYRVESRRNELDLLLKVAELEKQRVDQVRSLAGGLYDSLFGGGKGIAQFFQGVLKDQGRKVFENLAQEALGGQSLNLGLPGKIFQGTLLGKDPLKDSAIVLATAGFRLDAAATKLLSLSPSSGGGGAISSSAASTFGRLSGIFGGGGGGFSETDTPTWGLPTDGAGNGDYGGEFGDAVPVPSNGPSGLGKGIGIGAASLAGGVGIYSGIRQGGGRGAAVAAGSAISAGGAIAALLGSATLGPIGALAGGLIASILPAFFGDPKVTRAKDLSQEQQARSFAMPTGVDYSVSTSGAYVDHDYTGRTRTVMVTNNVYTTDPKSFQDFLLANPAALSTGIVGAISGGNGDDVVSIIGQKINPS